MKRVSNQTAKLRVSITLCFAFASIFILTAVVGTTFALLNPDNEDHILTAYNNGLIDGLIDEDAAIAFKDKYFGTVNNLDYLGSFGLIAFNNLDLSGTVYSNFLTKDVGFNGGSAGVPNFSTLSYVAGKINPITGTSLQYFNKDSVIIVGEDNVFVGPTKSNPWGNYTINTNWIGNGDGGANTTKPWKNQFWQDYDEQFLDLNKVKENAVKLNQWLANTYNENINVEYIANENQQAKTRIRIADDAKVAVVNATPSSEGAGMGEGYEITNMTADSTLIMNIDMKNMTNTDQRFVKGVTVTMANGTVYDFDDFVNLDQESTNFDIIWNIYDSTQPDMQARGTNFQFESAYGYFLAPESYVIVQNYNGTIVANDIKIFGNNSQWGQFTGDIGAEEEATYCVTVHHKSKETGETVHEDTGRCDLKPGDPYNRWPRDIEGYSVDESATEGEESGIIENHDVEITYYYIPEEYSVIVYHIYNDQVLKKVDKVVLHDEVRYIYESVEYQEFIKIYDSVEVRINRQVYTEDTITIDSKFSSNTVVVVYEYFYDNYDVTTKHVLEGDEIKEIHQSSTETLEHHDSWSTSPIEDDPKYEPTGNLAEGSDPAEGEDISSDKTVIYTYRLRDYKLSVEHIDSAGNPIEDGEFDYDETKHYEDEYDVTLSDDVREKYNCTASTETSGQITSDTTVTFMCEIRSFTVTVKHMIGDVTYDETHASVNYGETYTSAPHEELKEKYDYTVSPSETVTVTDDVEIIYAYTIKRFTLTVHHEYEDGKEFSPDASKEYDYGEIYTADPIDNPAYIAKIKEGSLPATGEIKDNIEVTYVYVMRTFTIFIKYTTDGEQSLNDEHVPDEPRGSYHYLEPYQENDTAPSEEAQKRYNCVTESNQTFGVITQDVEIVYVCSVKLYTITVYHKDESGSQLAEPDTYELPYDEVYNATPKDDLLRKYENYRSDKDQSGTVVGDLEITLTYYDIKSFSFELKHVDRAGETIENGRYDKNETLEFGSEYDATLDSVLAKKYNCTTDAEELTGILEGPLSVTWTCELIDYSITIKHVDTEGQPLNDLEDETKTGYYYGQEYSESDTADVAHDKYNCATTDARSGVIEGDLEITYVCTVKEFSIKVEYKDESGSDLPESFEDTRGPFQYGYEYSESDVAASEKITDNYICEATSATSGTLTSDTTVTYECQPKTYHVTIKHIDKATDAVLSTDTEEAKYGTQYTAACDAEYYTKRYQTCEFRPSQAIDITHDGLEIEVLYSNPTPYKVTVKHVDENGDDLIAPTDTNIEYGSTYTATADAELLKKYENVVCSIDPSQTCEMSADHEVNVTVEGVTEITFKYTNVRVLTITINHIDKATGAVLDTETTTAEYGSEYTASHKTQYDDKYAKHEFDPSQTITVDDDHTMINIYYSEILKYTVTVKHVDAAGKELAQPTTVDIEYDQKYVASQDPELAKKYENITCAISNSSDCAIPNGTVEITVKGEIAITFTYDKIRVFNITVKHVDESGNNLIDPTTDTREYGQTYEAKADADLEKTYSSYHINPEGEVEITEDTVFTIVYSNKTEFTLTVKYVDTENSSLENGKYDGIVARYYYGDKPDKAKSGPKPEVTKKYDCETIDVLPSEVMDNIEISYVCSIKTFNITITYLDENGDNYAETVSESVQYGDPFTVELDCEANYTYVFEKGQESYESITEDTEIVIRRTLKKATITVKHVVTDDDSRSSEQTFEGVGFGTSFDAKPLDELLVEYDVNPASATVLVDKDQITITFAYTRKEFTLTVRHIYLNKDDTTAAESFTSKTYKYGANYTTSPKTDDQNYNVELSDSSAPSEGTITGNTEVVYIYRKKTAIITVKHIVDGELETTEELPYEWGDTYETSPLERFADSHNYVVDADEIGAVSGDMTITYTYSRKQLTVEVHHRIFNSIVTFALDASPEIEVEYKTVKHGDPLDIEPRAINYRQVIISQGQLHYDAITQDTVVIIDYMPISARIVVKHLDKDGNPLIAEQVIDDKYVGDEYVVAPDEELLKLYTAEVDYAETGTIEQPELTITYTYSKRVGKLTVKHLDKDGNPLATTVEEEIEYGEPYHAYPADDLLDQYTYTVDSAESGTMLGDVTIIYTYTLKEEAEPEPPVEPEQPDEDVRDQPSDAPKTLDDIMTYAVIALLSSMVGAVVIRDIKKRLA